jgi:hypothetical protein
VFLWSSNLACKPSLYTEDTVSLHKTLLVSVTKLKRETAYLYVSLIPHIRLDGVDGIHTAGDCGTLFISSDMQIRVSFSLDPG